MKTTSWLSPITSKVLRACLTILMVALWTACSDDTANFAGPGQDDSGAKVAAKMSMPTITCGTATQVSININVQAGATGAPAGFSLQWMTAAAYAANGNAWYLSDDSRLCKASFSGNANISRYNLLANQSVTVNIGELLFDNGASTNCSGALVCETDYVFRAFAHANSTRNRSDFTANLTCSTLPCGSGETCTFTQGRWKQHGLIAGNKDEFGNFIIEWPVVNLTLGTVNYTDLQLLAILNAPAAGNGLLVLAHQLIAAKLNVANGADAVPSATNTVAADIAAADALIGGLVAPPVGAGFIHASATGTLTTALANYNEGATGPGHCGN